jgi:hypothetical protein
MDVCSTKFIVLITNRLLRLGGKLRVDKCPVSTLIPNGARRIITSSGNLRSRWVSLYAGWPWRALKLSFRTNTDELELQLLL